MEQEVADAVAVQRSRQPMAPLLASRPPSRRRRATDTRRSVWTPPSHARRPGPGVKPAALRSDVDDVNGVGHWAGGRQCGAI